jgi:hypothetical protein
MTRSKHVLMLCCALVWCGYDADAAPDKWADQACEVRVAIVVPLQPGVLKKRPVIVPWARIATVLQGAEVKLSSLRLFSDGTPLAFQVDHRDAEGNLLPAGNVTLDPQDELVFVCAADRQTTVYLYGSAEPRPAITYPSSVQMTAVRQGAGRVHYRLSSGDLSIGIQGAGALDLNATTPINLGRGSVVELKWRGQSAIWPQMNWAVFMNGHPFAIERWQRVKVIVDGPVHKVVAVQGVGKQHTDKDGVALRRADITRYFSMFAHCPLYDIEDVIACQQVQPQWEMTYTDRFFPGRSRDANDVLWDGSAGTTRQFVLADKDIKTNRSGSLVDNKKVATGWCAWYDTQEETGLTVFYRPEGVKLPTVGFKAGWELYSSVNRMSFQYDGLQAPTRLRHRFRIMGLTKVDSKDVAVEYTLWADDAGDSVTIGQLERSR